MRYLAGLIAGLLLSVTLTAQVSVRSNFNLDTQPSWGPTGFEYVEYYYLPDIETYYSVPQNRYYYYENGNWINRSSLPSRFNNYDLYKSYKVVMVEKEPWQNHKTYRTKYSKFKNRHDQQIIRDSRDSKYYVNKNHPEHENWLIQQKHDNGKHKGWYKEKNNKGSRKNIKQKDKRNN